MKFHSNRCIAVRVPSLVKAERFYSEVMGLALKSQSRTHLEYSTGTFLLYVNRAPKARAPIPSFDVKEKAKARDYLKRSGCKILVKSQRAFYFRDPFGVVNDVIET